MKKFRLMGGLAAAGFGCAGLACGDPCHELTPPNMRDLRAAPLGFPGCGKAHLGALRHAHGEEPGGGGGADPAEAPGATDCLHNNLDFEIFPTTASIAGSNTMTIKSNVDGLSEFTFMLRSNFTISTVVLNGTTTIPGASLAYVGTYGRKVTLDRAYNTGEILTVRVNYAGPAVNDGFGAITFGSMSGQTFVGSLSEPYYAGTWWPCKDGDVAQPGDNSDKATLDIAVTAPSELYTVCNGVLQGVDVLTGGRSRYRWHSDIPISTYLVSFGSHPYHVYSTPYEYPLPGGGVGTMPFNMYISPAEDTEGARYVWGLSTQMMAAYRGYFGEYPFVSEKYGCYQFTFGGGMEHQTITGMGGFWEWVAAHELGHQWWGDNVTCKYWGDIWLNEGFATYAECVWAERHPGSSGMPEYHSWINGRRPSSGGINRSVYCYDVGNIGAIFDYDTSYAKGAWVLHQLRGFAGDAPFLQTLANYRAAYERGAATTDDFRNVASTTIGRDMTQFFAQWVYGIGAPEYAYGWQSVNINGQNYLRLRIRQTQSASYGANGRFEMPIDVQITTTAATVMPVADDTATTQWFLLPIPGAATGVTLDPEDWILITSKTAEAYGAGPPKVIAASPAPGATTPPGSGPTSVAIGFSDAITATGAAFTVAGPHGNVPFTYSFSAGTLTATLTFSGALPPGDYTVTASDAITANSMALDGEIADPRSPASLPSGNGIAGGAAAFAFTVGACPSDFNLDGQVDFFDYLDFVQAFSAEDPAADFNGDGQVDFFDYLDFAAAFAGGC